MMQVAFWESDRARSKKRPLPDSNRGWRICNPLPYRLAKGPALAYRPSLHSRQGLEFGKAGLRHAGLQSARQGVDAVLALFACGGIAPCVGLARLQVIEHHGLG